MMKRKFKQAVIQDDDTEALTALMLLHSVADIEA